MKSSLGISVVDGVFVVEVCHLKEVIQAAVDEMAHCGYGVCNLKDANAGPELISFTSNKSYRSQC